MGQLLAGLGNRVFLMNNVHEDQPVLFESRWAMSYLRGPLTRDQIRKLLEPLRPALAAVGAALTRPGPASAPTSRRPAALPDRRRRRPQGPARRRSGRRSRPAITQFFLPSAGIPDAAT
jgi:hypothetical protein